MTFLSLWDSGRTQKDPPWESKLPCLLMDS